MRWPDGPVCPHCGDPNRAYFLKPRNGQQDDLYGPCDLPAPLEVQGVPQALLGPRRDHLRAVPGSPVEVAPGRST